MRQDEYSKVKQLFKTLHKCWSFSQNTPTKALRFKSPFIDILPFIIQSALRTPGNAEWTRRKHVRGAQKLLLLLRLRKSDTNKFQESLNWYQSVAQCWHSSACKCLIASNISLQSAGCLQGIRTNSKRMSNVSLKAVAHKASNSILHYTLSEKSLLFSSGKNIKCFTLLTS